MSDLWFVQQSILRNSGTQQKNCTCNVVCYMMTVINHLNMLQNKLIRAAAIGVCGEPIMINRLLDNGSCFALGYEVMSSLCFLSRYGCIRWRTESEKVRVCWQTLCPFKELKRCLWDFSEAVFQIWLKCSDVEPQQQKGHSAFHTLPNQKQQQWSKESSHS